VARFADEAGARTAAETLRERDLDPDRSAIENPFFDPTAPLPEARGLVWGAAAGAILGILLFQAINADLLWVPRWSPMMSADEFAVPFLGLGLGAAVGGFLGGVAGTLRPVPDSTAVVIAVAVPDDRREEVAGSLRDAGARSVRGRVTYHENPQQRE
jgi:hypothetical protein